MTDVLAAVLRHVRIEASLFGRIELGAPWGARIGRRDTVSLHHVLQGELWLELEGEQLQVGAGDLLLLPHGLPHCLRYRPGAPVVDEQRWMAEPPPGARAVLRKLGGDGPQTVVLCAALRVGGAGSSILLRGLPPAVRLQGHGAEAVPGLGRLLDGIRDELREDLPGGPILAARFAELLLLQAIRAALQRPAPAGSCVPPSLATRGRKSTVRAASTGSGAADFAAGPGSLGSCVPPSLATRGRKSTVRAASTGSGAADFAAGPGSLGSLRAALSDEHVARALDALYQAPERAWTVSALARVAGQSRAAFARTFREQVGEGPIQHLTRWRMELAKERLRERPELGLAEIARSVGYASEAAFGVAFRREVGVPPGSYRDGA
jgi:AraC-like DNA-binding protein